MIASIVIDGERSRPAVTYILLLSSHTVPQRLHPFPAKNSEDHHERMEEVREIPSVGRPEIFIL